MRVRSIIIATFLCGISTSALLAAELFVGRAVADITPDQPVPLSGQMRTRISQGVESPLKAAVLALETRDGERCVDAAILVSCDLVAIREGLVEDVRGRLKDRLPGLDLEKLVLSATHTHTAPETVEGRYDVSTVGVMQPEEYRKFFSQRVADAVEQAWRSRAPGQAGWGLGHAVIAQNRLAVYADGHAQMYGRTDRADFVRFEGYEDHGVEVLCFWDRADKLIATAINVPCPAQEVEGRSWINADFWHPVREALRQQHGEDLVVLAWTGAGGDQSPHGMYRKQAEERMRRLRNLDGLNEIARRILAAWEEAYAGARQEKHADLTLTHQVQNLELPVRLVTPEEAAEARQKADSLANDPTAKRLQQWHMSVADRFERQQPGDVYPAEVHVIRLGDIAIATNPFELYTDYGIAMKARSPALQTFVIQLAGSGSYLPTARGVAGGAYGAVIQSNKVSPEGGRVLVERTLDMINSLWPASP